MSDAYYLLVRTIGRPIFFSAAKTLVLHEERARLPGGCLLAANHHSYFDAPILVGTTTRFIDWLSIKEFFQTFWQRSFMQGINCLALDRSRRDSTTTREMVRRLKAGRMVGLFPEAGLRKSEDSVIQGGEFTSGVVGLAQLAQVPVLPVVVLGAGQFIRPLAWLPIRRTFLAVNYGEPLYLPVLADKAEARAVMAKSLSNAFRILFAEIRAHETYLKHTNTPWWTENYGSFARK